jgi:hypothetical protein
VLDTGVLGCSGGEEEGCDHGHGSGMSHMTFPLALPSLGVDVGPTSAQTRTEKHTLTSWVTVRCW